ncbi:MAG: hypothetical protein LEGION0398_MBIBDBAK_01365 [Legionellaceae bacterium]
MKWKTFIKFSSLTKDDLYKMLLPHIENEERLSKCSQYIHQRAQLIKKELLKSESFRTILLAHSQKIFSSIKQEITEYNSQFKKANDKRRVMFNGNAFNDYLDTIYKEIFNQTLTKAAAILTHQSEILASFKHKDSEEIKAAGIFLEDLLNKNRKIKVEPKEIYLQICEYLNNANKLNVNVSIFTKIKYFLYAVIYGENMNTALRNAFQNPAILNKLTTNILLDLEQIKIVTGDNLPKLFS